MSQSPFSLVSIAPVTDAGIDYALLKYAGAETALSAAIPLDINAATGGCILVLLAGVVQGLMASKTNWGRLEYKVPWPHTFALENNKNKLKFDMIQRAHLNFVENYPQYLATAYFALQLAPNLATLFGTFFLLGRVVFALGYYSGDATQKNKVRMQLGRCKITHSTPLKATKQVMCRRNLSNLSHCAGFATREPLATCSGNSRLTVSASFGC